MTTPQHDPSGWPMPNGEHLITNAHLDAWRAGAVFEKAMAALIAETGTTAAETAELRARILDMATHSGTSAADAAEAVRQTVHANDPILWTVPHGLPTPQPPKPVPRPLRTIDARITVNRTTAGYTWQITRHLPRTCCAPTAPSADRQKPPDQLKRTIACA